VRRNLTVIALGLLAVTGCAHDRGNRQEADTVPYSSMCCHSCADAQPSGKPRQGPEPRVGEIPFKPIPPPAVAKPVAPSSAGLPPAQAVPAIPDVVRPRELPDLPKPMPMTTVGEKSFPPRVIPVKPLPLLRDSSASPGPSTIPDISPKPAPPARVRPPVSEAQPEQVLTGTVESWRRTQRLRYAPADVEEANGGLVTLVGDPQLERMKEGQRIRVRGFLIPSADRAHPPRFQVQSMEVVE
jgi:hypothetical protein